MIIVNQDKNSIVNFNNIVSININDFEADGTWQRITTETLGTAIVLGDYKTEERTKEILEEITKCYANTEQYKCLSSMPNCESEEKVNVLNELAEKAFVYEMPKS